MSTLAVEHRPLRFDGVLGQAGARWVLSALVANVSNGVEFPSAVLFAGPSGVGKTSMARIVARVLNCEAPQSGEPCLGCDSCRQSLQPGHPSIIEIDAANYASAEEARDLVARVTVAHPFKHLVIIMDECHAMSRQAWDVLLRTIESNPDGASFLFCTTTPERLRPEVLSRVYRFDLTPPPTAEVVTKLQQVAVQRGVEVTPSVCFEVVHRSRGNVRLAYQLLEQVMLHPELDVEAVLGPGRFGLRLLEAGLRKDRLEGIRVLDEAWRRYGSAAEIYAEWMDSLETLLKVKFSEIDDDDPAVLIRFREMSAGYHETMVAAGMEAVADWARRGGKRSALSFAWAAYLRAIGGPTVVDSAAIGAARKHARKATAADLSDFTI